jgi:hypothetical protein
MPLSANSNYELLIDKLHVFISKYYLQLWVKGLLQLVLVLLSFYLLSTTLEYNLYFSTAIRGILFFCFCLVFVGLLLYWVIHPLYQYVHLSFRIDHKKAADIIGQHFPSVKDKLMNVLLLNDMENHSSSLELIQASIDQKSKSLVLVRFNEAIDWQRISQLLKYLILPFVIFIGVYIITPSLFRDSTYRLLNYNQVFSPKAPFEFRLLNTNLKVQQFEAINIQAKLDGKSLPENLNIFYKGVLYPMQKGEQNVYTYTLQNIESDEKFKLESAGFYSDDFKIDIVPKPMIADYEVNISHPSYTHFSHTTQKNIGDIQAVEGSRVIWKFKTNHVDDLYIKAGSNSYPAEKYINGYGVKLNLKNIANYTIFYKNNQSSFIDSQQYSVSLIPDAYPAISIHEFSDSINEILYYTGDISDDYGLGALYLGINYAGKSTKHAIQIPKSKHHSFQVSTQDIFKKYPKGAELDYYFEVYDNDQVNGSKSVKSSTFQLKKLTEKELEKRVDKNTEQIQANLAQSLKESKQLQKELEAARKKILQKSSLDFNDKKMLEELLKRQEELQQKLENSKDEIKRNFDKKNELTQQEKTVLEQQKQLEEMIEQMKNPELQELLQKINELLEKSDKKELLQSIDKLDQKSEKMEKNIDRLMQLYKNLDYKQKLNDMIEKLDALSKDQKKLALETELKKPSIEKQKELTKQVDEAKKKMDELNKLNSEVNKTDKKEYEDIKKDLDEANQDQKDAEKELGSDDEKDGADKQKSASDKLEQVKKKLNTLKNKQKKDQKKEDARMMRRLLENVMYLSFEQERIVEKTKLLSTQSPSYVRLIQEEQRLKEDFKLVEDTLYKIASRQVKIRKQIFEDVDKITNNTQLSIQRLVDRKPHMAISSEQYAMSSYNNLGLMISESLKNMEEDEDENEMDSDNPMCNNPKKGKKKKPGMSLEKLAQMQEQLNQQMEKLQQEMKQKGQQGKEGATPNGKDAGKSGGSQGQNGKESAEFARIAAQQQAIRNALKKIEESGNSPDKSGKKPLGGGLKNAMDKMNQTENDLVNKRMYEEMLRRQKDIQIKLLESAKAEREQDEEQQRESERAKNIKPEPPAELKRFLENKKQNESQIHRTPVGLTPYFKTLSEKYFKLIK